MIKLAEEEIKLERSSTVCIPYVYAAPTLSHQMMAGWLTCYPNSWSKERIQISSAITLATAPCSASIGERAAVGCFFAGQETVFLPK